MMEKFCGEVVLTRPKGVERQKSKLILVRVTYVAGPWCCTGLQRYTLAQAGIACRMLNGVLGAWYMRSCSINSLFVVVVLTTLKVMIA